MHRGIKRPSSGPRRDARLLVRVPRAPTPHGSRRLLPHVHVPDAGRVPRPDGLGVLPPGSDPDAPGSLIGRLLTVNVRGTYSMGAHDRGPEWTGRTSVRERV